MGRAGRAGGIPPLVALALLSVIVQIPFLERGISVLDEGSMLAISEALSRGEVLFRDRVTSLGPLTYELMAALFRLFEPHILVGRLFQAAVFVGCVLLAWGILNPLVGPRGALLGALALFALKPLGFRAWTMVHYSHVGILLCLGCLLCGIRFFAGRRRIWLVACGLGIGLTWLTKLNFAAAISVATVLAVAVDWWEEPGRRPRELLMRLAVLAGGVLLPVVLVLARFAAHGAAGLLLDQSVLRVMEQRSSFWISLPDLSLWSLRTEGAGREAFTYFPAPLFNLGWNTVPAVFSGPLALGIELCVKLAYYAPLALLGLSLKRLWRGIHGRGGISSRRSGELLVVLFGGAAYAAILHRPDWSHLMNIYPAVILVGVVSLLRHWPSMLGRAVSFGLVGAWLALAGATTLALFLTYTVPVETPRGRLLGTASRASQVQAVLDYLENLPPADPVAFLRGEPFYYFVTGRRIPLRFDALLMGLVRPEEDAHIAKQLEGVPRVIYNPKESPLVPHPIGEYAPRTADTLARRFRVGQVLSETAVVLERRPEEQLERAVLEEVWHSFTALHAVDDRLRREHWAFYRVVAAEPGGKPSPACFAFTRHVGPAEELRALPVFHPDLWTSAGSGESGMQARFEIRVAAPNLEEPITWTGLRAPGVPGQEVRISLAPVRGERAEIRFCSAPAGGPGVPWTVARFGWAEARVLAPPRR